MLADAPDVQAWLAAMSANDRHGLNGRLLTQALAGEAVKIDREAGCWSRVTLREQPSSLHPAGYPGWVRSAHLCPLRGPSPPSQTRVVVTLTVAADFRSAPASGRVTTLVHDTTNAAAAAPKATAGVQHHIETLSFGTLIAVDPAGVQHLDTGVEITVPDATLGEPAGGPVTLVDAAATFLGLPYLWGGASGFGVDCSGLVWLCFRRCGQLVARDANDQATTGTPVSRSHLQPGNLVFFGRERISHVGIALGPDEMIHAPGTGLTVERALIDRVHPGDFVGGRAYC